MEKGSASEAEARLAAILQALEPGIFSREGAAPPAERDLGYARLARRLIARGLRFGEPGDAPPGQGSTGFQRSESERPWLIIERAFNGYFLRDASVGESWVIPEDDRIDAALDLLADINLRLGTAGTDDDDRRVVLGVEPGNLWLKAHAERCPHAVVRSASEAEADGWACGCGVEFVPVTSPGRDPFGASA
jgi:hypothetical protein